MILWEAAHRCRLGPKLKIGQSTTKNSFLSGNNKITVQEFACTINKSDVPKISTSGNLHLE